jgi:hypothetical protein
MTDHVITTAAGKCLRCGVSAKDAYRVPCAEPKSRKPAKAEIAHAL